MQRVYTRAHIQMHTHTHTHTHTRTHARTHMHTHSLACPSRAYTCLRTLAHAPKCRYTRDMGSLLLESNAAMHTHPFVVQAKNSVVVLQGTLSKDREMLGRELSVHLPLYVLRVLFTWTIEMLFSTTHTCTHAHTHTHTHTHTIVKAQNWLSILKRGRSRCLATVETYRLSLQTSCQPSLKQARTLLCSARMNSITRKIVGRC
jgi:hypothetical protein